MYTINNSTTARYGFALTYPDGHKVDLNQKTTDNYLRLPDDAWQATGRHYIALKDITDGYQIPQGNGPRTSTSTTPSTPKTNPFDGILSYLSEKDKEAFEALVKKALRRREAEKIQAQIEALKARAAELKRAEEEAE